jgi:DNA-binding NtrC family response regulator
MGENTKHILIVDYQLGFVFWLGQALDRAGFVCWPAKSVADARALLKQMRVEIGLLVIDTSMAGASALSHEVFELQGHLRVVGLHASNEDMPSNAIGVDSWLQRPSNRSLRASFDFVETIRKQLSLSVNFPRQPLASNSRWPSLLARTAVPE